MPPVLAGGRLRLIEVIGAGGMAVVLRAEEAPDGLARAVKLLKPALAARTPVRQRFEREARTLLRLHHPHIVRVVEVGVDGGLPWLAMEVVEGGTLLDRVRARGPLPADVVERVALELLAALEHAHRAGVVHRDLKPANVLLARDGRAVLTDFGLARDDEGEDARTRTGIAMGTPAYMAPEQRVSARRADGRADLYSLAATLFAVATGEDPFDLSGTALTPAMLEGVPPHLHAVLHRATRPDPADRYPSAAAMADAIRLATAGRAPDAATPRPPPPGPVPPRLAVQPSRPPGSAPSPPPPPPTATPVYPGTVHAAPARSHAPPRPPTGRLLLGLVLLGLGCGALAWIWA